MGINSQKVALLCPGQASQKVGMCSDLYNQRGFAKEHVDMACDILGYDIKNIMFERTAGNFTNCILARGKLPLARIQLVTSPAVF